MTLPDGFFDAIVYKIREEKQLELACFQPRFVIEQVAASCRFMEQPPTLEPRFLNYAIDNLRVRSSVPAAQPAEAPMQQAAD
jgi:hypothetical protein